METLPNPMFHLGTHTWLTQWVPPPEKHMDKINKEWERVVEAPGWNPKVVHLENDWYMLDLCGKGKVHSVKTIKLVDHPFLERLPPNAPRTVKTIYKKENILKYFRTDEYWTISKDLDKADEAWKKYLKETH